MLWKKLAPIGSQDLFNLVKLIFSGAFLNAHTCKGGGLKKNLRTESTLFNTCGTLLPSGGDP